MEDLLIRIHNIINTCWESFSAKVGGGLIEINKEASMQLHFAYLLKNNLDLAIHHADEAIKVELETGINVNGRLREADIIISITKDDKIQKLPIELKCYKTYTSNGSLRGAQDLFRFGIYEDLQLLEAYTNNQDFIQGLQLTMTDSRVFGFPNSTKGKGWGYNTANGNSIINGFDVSIPIAGNPDASITLTKNYQFNWVEINNFYFLKLQGN
ncbi:MAG: hypothetical protein IPG89_05845 [Bacteroidetes bacterium]|nr:hypothetical protein [Bacteroidota bacterium]